MDNPNTYFVPSQWGLEDGIAVFIAEIATPYMSSSPSYSVLDELAQQYPPPVPLGMELVRGNATVNFFAQELLQNVPPQLDQSVSQKPYIPQQHGRFKRYAR